MTTSAPVRDSRTIFALSSGPGPAGVAVIRISGSLAGAALAALAGRLPTARMATVMKLRDGAGEALDEALVLYFPEGASFTGEEIVELHVHGGRAVVRAVLAALAGRPGLRFAERGEFARRALENGKLDLPQVEALASLVAAETDWQRRQALRGMSGLLGRRAAEWRALLLEARALVAAAIDFADEADTDGVEETVWTPLRMLESELHGALATADRGRILADGYRVAIVGKPNVGKSTLLNRLAGSDVAIVTEHAGTTRDVIEVRLDIDGYAVILQDTAGLRETADPVERIGIARTRNAITQADLVLWLDDIGAFGSDEVPTGAPTIRIRTKSDVSSGATRVGELSLSARTGVGIDSLLKQIVDHISQIDRGEAPLVTHERQRRALEAALHHVQQALSEPLERIEFVAEHVNDADRTLDELLGSVGVEEVLGAIFARFCIGK